MSRQRRLAGDPSSMLQREFSRLAIAGRGEPAMRIMHAVRELDVNRADRLHVIALHTEADRDAWFVRYADETVCLDQGPLEHALRACRAEAAWVGRELASDHHEFAELCDRLGIVFVGPDPDATRRLTDEIATRNPPGRAAWRCRSSPTARARSGLSECVITRFSDADRRCWPNPRVRP